jgi:hypothetical protein
LLALPVRQQRRHNSSHSGGDARGWTFILRHRYSPCLLQRWQQDRRQAGS